MVVKENHFERLNKIKDQDDVLNAKESTKSSSVSAEVGVSYWGQLKYYAEANIRTWNGRGNYIITHNEFLRIHSEFHIFNTIHVHTTR